MSLVGALVAVAIMGIVAIGFSRVMTQGARTQRSLELKGSLEDVRNLIRRGLSCKATLPDAPSDCVAADYIALKRTNGTDLVPAAGANGTKLGDWYVRASCSTTALEVSVSRKRDDGTFLTDPLTQRELSWTPLFTSNPICAEFFGGDGEVEAIAVSQYTVGAPFEYTSPGPATSGTFTRTIGSFTLVPKGDRLSVSSKAVIAARGTGRFNRVRLRVTKGGTAVYTDPDLHRIGGVANGSSVDIKSFDEFLLNVDPSESYLFTFEQISQDTGSSLTAFGNVPAARLLSPVSVVVTQYRSK